ncbi:unnamed protein product [Porites lobata]|uniref:Uncharacterized protein n=1 Tax=Porites lobata TaxID=104759 RepID=A0ABN8NWH0_9CNID|nr:unnamed protein product [Porites lobata]
MTGLCFIYTENSILNPFSSAPHLHLFLCGIKHTMGLTSHQHLPVTMSLLRQIKEEVSHAPDFQQSDKLMLWSALTLAFYNFQQSSEFTSPSASEFNPLVHLSATDVSFTSNGCLGLHLKKYLALHPTGSASPLYVWQPPYQSQSYWCSLHPASWFPNITVCVPQF